MSQCALSNSFQIFIKSDQEVQMENLDFVEILPSTLFLGSEKELSSFLHHLQAWTHLLLYH
jgi:hypothetical protein